MAANRRLLLAGMAAVTVAMQLPEASAEEQVSCRAAESKTHAAIINRAGSHPV